MEYRVIKSGIFTIQLQILPDIKILAYECEGHPMPLGVYKTIERDLLNAAVHEVRDSND